MSLSGFFDWHGWSAVGTMLSFLSLVAAVFAACFASYAKDAAQNAVQTSDTISISGRLQSSLVRVNHIRDLVHNSDWKFAVYLLRELQSDLSSINASKSVNSVFRENHRFEDILKTTDQLATSLELTILPTSGAKTKKTNAEMLSALGHISRDLAHIQTQVKDEL